MMDNQKIHLILLDQKYANIFYCLLSGINSRGSFLLFHLVLIIGEMG